MQSNKYSNYKIAWFPEKLEAMRAGYLTPPICVRVKPTNFCNHDCFFCVYKSSFSGMHKTAIDRESDYIGTVCQLSRDALLKLIDDFWAMGVKAVTFSGGGEPLMHKDIVEVMQLARERKIDYSIITNGQLLNGERAFVLAYSKWVRVSVDYANGAQMKASRGVPERLFDELLENLIRFSKLKSRTCDLFVNFIIHQGNYKSLVEAARIFSACGVDNIRFSPMWTRDFLAYHEPLRAAVLEQLAEIAGIGTSTTINSTYDLESTENTPWRSYRKCYFWQMVPVVAADGGVYACHNKAYDPLGLIGNIHGSSFQEVWKNEALKFMLEFDCAASCKHQCAADSKNLLIHDLLASHGDNFV